MRWAQSDGNVIGARFVNVAPSVAQLYGVYREDEWISERAVIIVDVEGIIRYIDVYDIGEHPDPAQIIEELEKLG